ncbi:MAG: ATP-dependent DNA helicase RecG [Treponema sp.]|nr:ATP-dependent DNA helicase RecG [Treponema sp.]
MKINDIKNPVSTISGVGPKLSKLLSKLNIFTAGDLLQYYPRDYEDRSVKVSLDQYKTNPKIHTVARVMSHEWFGYGRMKTLKININDGTAPAELICFNRAFLENQLPPGSVITVTGSFYVKYNKLQSSAFEVSPMSLNQLGVNSMQEVTAALLKQTKPLNTGIIPVYHLTEGLSQKVLTKAINTAVSQYAHGIEDEIPAEIISERGLLHKQQAISQIHMPESLDQAELARKTLAYEEFYHLQYAIAQRAFRHRGFIPGDELSQGASPLEEITTAQFRASLSPLQRQLMDKLPFDLTPDQQKVIYQMNCEIDTGFTQRYKPQPDTNRPPFTMARLLQGDVGSGKTLTALFVCLRVINYGGQCAFMAPTEILARQHAETTSRMLDSLGVRTAFLTGNIKAAGRTQLLKALKAGEIDILVGTHALFSAQVTYKDLQLAVIDEQHRFGVLQRQAIIAKGRVSEENGMTSEPHVLMMSATPIPQTLALTMFGDLDVSTIKTMPNGRKPITTYLVKEGNETNAYEAVRKELAKGHQAYFVYPAIQADGDFKSAEKNFENLKKIFPEYKCALVHSKIDEDQQAAALRDFHDGKIQILVATTVIEVGVDVPNATCMVIEQADHFGMAQLHQLRGRVGRGSEQSFCFLIYNKNLSETGIERMKALRQSTDGFYIAEQDLKTRGPGELQGTAQAGELTLGIADISKDKELLLQARADAFSSFSKISQQN